MATTAIRMRLLFVLTGITATIPTLAPHTATTGLNGSITVFSLG